MPPLDTSPEAERVQIEAFRRMGPEGRFKAGMALSRLSRELMAAGVRMRHPEYNERQVQLAVIRLILGESLFAKVYPESVGILP